MRVRVAAVMIGALATGLAACGGSSGGSGGGPKAGAGPVQHPAALVGEVGKNDAFTIHLTDGSGAPITHLAAGTYTMTVHDDSSIHDFHLSGAGVDKLTSVGGKGVNTFTVTFKPGTYTFQCDPHSSQMHGSFVVS